MTANIVLSITFLVVLSIFDLTFWSACFCLISTTLSCCSVYSTSIEHEQFNKGCDSIFFYVFYIFSIRGFLPDVIDFFLLFFLCCFLIFKQDVKFLMLIPLVLSHKVCSLWEMWFTIWMWSKWPFGLSKPLMLYGICLKIGFAFILIIHIKL